MESPNVLLYLILAILGILVILVVAYLMLKSKMHSKTTKYKAQLVEGTKAKSFSLDVFYQKFYVRCSRIPLLSRYLLKLRRRLEILNIEDEYVTRKQSAQIIIKSMGIAILILFATTMWEDKHL